MTAYRLSYRVIKPGAREVSKAWRHDTVEAASEAVAFATLTQRVALLREGRVVEIKLAPEPACIDPDKCALADGIIRAFCDKCQAHKESRKP